MRSVHKSCLGLDARKYLGREKLIKLPQRRTETGVGLGGEGHTQTAHVWVGYNTWWQRAKVRMRTRQTQRWRWEHWSTHAHYPTRKQVTKSTLDELVPTATNIAILAASMIYTYITLVPARETLASSPSKDRPTTCYLQESCTAALNMCDGGD